MEQSGTEYGEFFLQRPGHEPETHADSRQGVRRPVGGNPGPADAGHPDLDKLVDELAKGKAMEQILRK